ncbi:MAG: hypothetical protein IKN42_05650 [Elusimicrobia bacterium]|nr:hypothetical protein [Elusimicrobiota bacterium]
MKLLNCSITRIIVAVMFVFSITGNVFAFYHKDGNWLVCDYCGARHINSFPRDGHYAWCKYAPATSSSNSGTVYVPKTTSNSSDYAAASVATLALGSMISDLISGSGTSAKTQEQIAAEQKKQEEQDREKRLNDYKKEMMLEDEKFWQSGDYIIKEGNLKLKDKYAKAYGIYNTKTQKWVLNADEQKDNEDGRILIFRDFKKRADGKIGFDDHIRLLNCKDENSPYKKPLVWIDGAHEYYKEKRGWRKKGWHPAFVDRKIKEGVMYVINDNDELEELEPDCNRGTFGIPQKNFLSHYNGKYGIVFPIKNYPYNGDSYYSGYKKFYEYKATPIEYDSVQVFHNYYLQDAKTPQDAVYLAKNKDDIYMFNFQGERLSPKLAQYDSITQFPKVMDDFYMVSKDNKFGAVNGNGTVVVPLVYSDSYSFFYSINDVISAVSFTNWYKNKVKPYLTQKGKYEKEADYQARLQDKEKQEQYVIEKTKNADKEYVDEFKNKISLSIGNYDTEAEKFTINENVIVSARNSITTWNTIELAVPIKEAEAFEKNFKNMAQDALKNATFGICCDVIAIAKITFKMPDGKTYTFDSTKNGK